MTPAHIASLREKVGLWGRLIVAVWTDVRLAGGVAQALAQRNQKPGTKPMSVFDALGSLTKADIIGYIDKAETLQGPLTEIRSVVNHHFRDIREDATVGVDLLKRLATALAVVPGPYMAVFAFAALLIKGTPHNTGEGGIGAPAEGAMGGAGVGGGA